MVMELYQVLESDFVNAISDTIKKRNIAVKNRF